MLDHPLRVMAGLRAGHPRLRRRKKDMDGRDKRGHDGGWIRDRPKHALKTMPTMSRVKMLEEDQTMGNNTAIVPPAPVAVIGLGNMGAPMGACLIRAGYVTTGFDVLESACQKFAATGGRVADDIAAAVAAAE